MTVWRTRGSAECATLRQSEKSEVNALVPLKACSAVEAGTAAHLESSLHDALDVGPEWLHPNGCCDDANGFCGLGTPAQGILLQQMVIHSPDDGTAEGPANPRQGVEDVMHGLLHHGQ